MRIFPSWSAAQKTEAGPSWESSSFRGVGYRESLPRVGGSHRLSSSFIFVIFSQIWYFTVGQIICLFIEGSGKKDCIVLLGSQVCDFNVRNKKQQDQRRIMLTDKGTEVSSQNNAYPEIAQVKEDYNDMSFLI